MVSKREILNAWYCFGSITKGGKFFFYLDYNGPMEMHHGDIMIFQNSVIILLYVDRKLLPVARTDPSKVRGHMMEMGYNKGLAPVNWDNYFTTSILTTNEY